jgi:hypothetical protein
MSVRLWLGINIASPILLVLALAAKIRGLLNPEGELSVFYQAPKVLFYLCLIVPPATLLAFVLNALLCARNKAKGGVMPTILRSVGSTFVFVCVLLLGLVCLWFFTKFNWSEA